MKRLQLAPLRLSLPLLLFLAVCGVASSDGSTEHNAMGSSTRSVEDSVFLHVTRVDFFTGPSRLTLECDGGSSGAFVFWRELNGLTEQVTVSGSGPATSKITFSVTPEREGTYYCTEGEEKSRSSSVEILAYPLQNQTVKSVKTLTARLHDDVTLPCVFSPGALSHRYSIQWFKALLPIDAENITRYSISPDDFSLSIAHVVAPDDGHAYYCVVDVKSGSSRFSGYHSIGPSIRLVVTDSLSITRGPSPSTHLPSPSSSSSSSVVFSCTAFGLPPPTITWLYQGSKVTAATSQNKVYSPPSNTSLDTEGATATRELFVTDLREADSGLVECLAMQTGGDGELVVVGSSASLSIIPSSFKPHLIPTSVGVELSLRLPALFPSSFSLIIHYYDDSETLVGKSPLVSPSFANTRSVDYVITADELPSVTVFSARVQVVAMEMEGELSEISNLITVSDLSSSQKTTGCDCDLQEATPTDSTTQTVLIFFVVLLILLLSIAMGVAICVIVMTIKRLRRASSKDDISERSYSRSRSSYRSGFHSNYSSRTHSPCSDRSRSPSINHSSRSVSRSYDFEVSIVDNKGRGVAPEGGARGRGVAPEGGARGREEPEGSITPDTYLALKSVPTDDLRHRTDSTASCVTNSIVSRPLPSTPYGERRVADSTSGKREEENEYEELQAFKKKRKKVRSNHDGEGEREGKREGGKEGEDGGMEEDITCGGGAREEGREEQLNLTVEVEGEWLVVGADCQKKVLSRELEETTTV